MGPEGDRLPDPENHLRLRQRPEEARYAPRLSMEEVEGKQVLVIWAPASETPPHQAPDGDRAAKKYWVRIDQQTVDAQARGLLTSLVQQSAIVPWDSRVAADATVDDISETMVREHLRAGESALLDEPEARTIYRKMDIVRRVNDHEAPRNVAILFFSRATPPDGFRARRSRPASFGREPRATYRRRRSSRAAWPSRSGAASNTLAESSSGPR